MENVEILEWRKSLTKLNARAILQEAVREGKLIRPTKCQKCQKECKPHGHHEDHNLPLDVMWLCPKCHKRRDMELEEERWSDPAYVLEHEIRNEMALEEYRRIMCRIVPNEGAD